MRRRRSGAVAVEFALTLPLLFTLVVAVVDYGWFFVRQAAVVDAARDAVRMGVTAVRDEDPRLVAEAALARVLADAGMPCDLDCTLDAEIATTGGYLLLRVDVSRPYDPVVGLLPVPALTEAASEMLLEEQDLSFYGLAP